MAFILIETQEVTIPASESTMAENNVLHENQLSFLDSESPESNNPKCNDVVVAPPKKDIH